MKKQDKTMSFRKKIDKLLNTNSLNINTVFALEKFVGAGVGSIRKYYDKDQLPGLGTIKKIKKAFNITDDHWDNPESYKSIENLTYEMKDESKMVEEEHMVPYSIYKAHIDDKNEIIRMLQEKLLTREKQKD